MGAEGGIITLVTMRAIGEGITIGMAMGTGAMTITPMESGIAMGMGTIAANGARQKSRRHGRIRVWQPIRVIGSLRIGILEGGA